MSYELESSYRPRGDQGQAIAKLLKSVEAGNRHQTLLGVTGSGKTFTIANVIRELDRPALIISHNKTLAAQLYSEFKQFFPRNAVEYFVSYFDYYQPEAYIPRSDTYIEKDSSINEEIERLRLSATSALLSRRDTIVVASVSCIYGVTSPEDYLRMLLTVKRGQQISREAVLGRLVDMLYERNDVNFVRGKFRVRGDVVEVYPATADEEAVRLEFFGDEIDAITRFDPLTGHAHESLGVMTFFPAKQFVTPADKLNRALTSIRTELDQRIIQLESVGKLLEAQRLKMRTEYDLEMLQEMGFCNGIENYSRHLSGRPPGSKPFTLLDFFPKDFLLVIDESHATIPQIGGMYEGDKSRKTVLVEYGFRLPSALDNRPLNFPEFMGNANQLVYVSATPAEFEIKNSIVGNTGYFPHKRERIGEEELVPFVVAGGTAAVSSPSPNPDGTAPVPPISRTDQPPNEFDVHTPGAPLVVEQIIRPTGLLDPKITLKGLKNQIDDTIELCRRAGGTPGARPRHHPDETHRGRPLRLSARCRLESALSAQRHRHDRTGGNPARTARGRVRYPCRDQLASRRARPAGSLVSLHPRCRQGRFPPQPDLAHPDRRSRRASHQRRSGPLRRHRHAKHAGLDLDLRLPPHQADGVQRKARHHPTTVRRAVQESLHTILRGREIAASVIQEAGGDFNLTELLRELEEEMQQASANLEFERAALLRDQIMEVKSGTGLTKIEPKRRPVKYTRGSGRRRSRV